MNTIWHGLWYSWQWLRRRPPELWITIVLLGVLVVLGFAIIHAARIDEQKRVNCITNGGKWETVGYNTITQNVNNVPIMTRHPIKRCIK